jgi:hypothetical protein
MCLLEVIPMLILDKAGSSVREGQKAADLRKLKMAELPKDEPPASSTLFIGNQI